MRKAVKSVSIARIFVQQFRRRAVSLWTPLVCGLFPVFSFAKPCEQTLKGKIPYVDSAAYVPSLM